MQIIFDSLSEFGRASRTMRPRAGGFSAGRSDTKSRSWDDGLGFEGTCAMAETGGAGWTKGVERMIKAKASVDALKSEYDAPVAEYDVTGHTLDVTDFLTGVPDCWDSSEDEPRPLLKVGVQLYTPGGNDIDSFINRGAALMSVLDDVIAQGIDVELWGCVSGKWRRDKSKCIDCRVLLKGREHAWAPAAVAFGICHPSVSRRLGFNAAECADELQGTSYFPGHSLNFEDDEPNGSDFDLWIGYSDMLTSSGYSTARSALTRVQAMVDKAIKRKATNLQEAA